LSTAGLQCFDESGSLIWQSTEGLARIVLTGYTNGAGNGVVVVPEWSGGSLGRPWFTTVNPTGFNHFYVQPGFQMVGNQLQWFVSYVGFYPNIKYICGVY
jgi:hypothetical protein